MTPYLVTISCNQKRQHVTKEQLSDIVEWLKRCSVTVTKVVYEAHGLYRQLHIHAIVLYKGRYTLLTKYGCRQSTGRDYQIHWRRITSLEGVDTYLHKQYEPHVLSRNHYHNHYFNQDTQKLQDIRLLYRKTASHWPSKSIFRENRSNANVKSINSKYIPLGRAEKSGWTDFRVGNSEIKLYSRGATNLSREFTTHLEK